MTHPSTKTTILALECVVPELALTGADYAAMAASLSAQTARERSLIETVVRRSGIERRYSVLAERAERDSRMRLPFYEDADGERSTAERMEVYEQLAPPLAIRAARRALESAGIAGGAITHLVTATCTGFFAPGIDQALIVQLDLPPELERMHIGFMGCHAAINALRAAQGLCQSNASARVLLICVELCTLHFQRGLGRHDLMPNSLFGDGAAAMVLKGADAKSPAHALELMNTASYLIPDSAALMTWRIGDTGFRMTLHSAVPDLIERSLGPVMTGFLARHGVALADVAAWAIHPGGPRILDSALRALHLPAEAGNASQAVLGAKGNMSSPTVLFILKQQLELGTRGLIAAAAFGPGLTAEMGLFRAN